MHPRDSVLIEAARIWAPEANGLNPPMLPALSSRVR